MTDYELFKELIAATEAAVAARAYQLTKEREHEQAKMATDKAVDCLKELRDQAPAFMQNYTVVSVDGAGYVLRGTGEQFYQIYGLFPIKVVAVKP